MTFDANKKLEDSKLTINQLEVQQIEIEESNKRHEGASVINKQRTREAETTLEEMEQELDETKQLLEVQRKKNLQYHGNWIPKDVHQKETALLTAQINANTDNERLAKRLGAKEKEASKRLETEKEAMTQLQDTLNEEQAMYSEISQAARRLESDEQQIREELLESIRENEAQKKESEKTPCRSITK